MRRGNILLILVVLMILGGWLRTRGLTLFSLNENEAFTWRVTSGSWADLFDQVARDNHPPLHFVLLKIWRGVFGSSLVSLRSLSLVCALGTLPALFWLTRVLARWGSCPSEEACPLPSDLAGITVCALFAVNSFQFFWASFVRMYSLGVLLAVLSSACLLRVLQASRRTLSAWMLYGVCAVLFLYTHYFALFTVGAQVLFALLVILSRVRLLPSWSDRWRTFRPLAFTVLGVSLAFLPWVSTWLFQFRQVRADFWTRPMSFWSIPLLCFQFFTPYDTMASRDEGMIASGACLLVLIVLAWRAHGGGRFLVLLILTPLLITMGLSRLDVYLFDPRYFLFAQVFLLTGIGMLVASLPTRLTRTLAFGLVFGNLGLLHLLYPYSWERLDCPGEKGAAAFLDVERHSWEPVVVGDLGVYLVMIYHGMDASEWRVYSGIRGFPHYVGASAINPGDQINEQGLETLKSPGVWVVDLHVGTTFSEVPIPRHWVLRRSEEFPRRSLVKGSVLVRYFTIPRSVPQPGGDDE